MILSSIKKTIYVILTIPILITIFIIGLPFRLFNRIPPITRSAIHNPYSIFVGLLEFMESKIDFIFNVIAVLFVLMSVYVILISFFIAF